MLGFKRGENEQKKPWKSDEIQETAEVVGGALESALKEYLETNKQSLIKTSMFSFSMLKNEMNKNTLYTFPFISITLLLLVTFTVLSWFVFFFNSQIGTKFLSNYRRNLIRPFLLANYSIINVTCTREGSWTRHDIILQHDRWLGHVQTNRVVNGGAVILICNCQCRWIHVPDGNTVRQPGNGNAFSSIGYWSWWHICDAWSVAGYTTLSSTV